MKTWQHVVCALLVLLGMGCYARSWRAYPEWIHPIDVPATLEDGAESVAHFRSEVSAEYHIEIAYTPNESFPGPISLASTSDELRAGAPVVTLHSDEAAVEAGSAHCRSFGDPATFCIASLKADRVKAYSVKITGTERSQALHLDGVRLWLTVDPFVSKPLLVWREIDKSIGRLFLLAAGLWLIASLLLPSLFAGPRPN